MPSRTGSRPSARPRAPLVIPEVVVGISLLLMFVVLYFVMIRPQMKRQKEHKMMLDALAKGDEVATSGGVVGKVTKLGESIVGIEVANGVEMQVQRHAIVQVLPKGTLK